MSKGSSAGAVHAASMVLITLAAGQFLMTLDSSVMNVAIATVAEESVPPSRAFRQRSRCTRW